jgi:hypothetical protein
MTRNTITATSICAVLTFAGPALAAVPAFDSAADPVYNDGWQSGDNGGFGFMPWNLVALGTSSGHFVASSTGNGDGIDDGSTRGVANDRDIDTAGRAWGMFASVDTNSDGAGALRELTGGPLSIGQSLLIDMDNGFIDAAGLNSVGVQFLVADGNEVYFRFEGGDSNYEVFVNNSAISTTTALGFADEGLTLQLTRTGFDTLDLTATLRNGDSQTLPLNMTGSDGAAIFGVFLNNDSAGAGPSQDAFFNSMSVIPEPASVSLLALGTFSLITKRKRNLS